MVKQAVAGDPYYRMLGGGIVLTGGGSKMRGMADLGEQVFDLPVRKAAPAGIGGLAEIVCEEGWSTGVGMLLHGRDGIVGSGETQRHLKRMIGKFKRIASLF